jgi:hypothetical protein
MIALIGTWRRGQEKHIPHCLLLARDTGMPPSSFPRAVTIRYVGPCVPFVILSLTIGYVYVGSLADIAIRLSEICQQQRNAIG